MSVAGSHVGTTIRREWGVVCVWLPCCERFGYREILKWSSGLPLMSRIQQIPFTSLGVFLYFFFFFFSRLKIVGRGCLRVPRNHLVQSCPAGGGGEPPENKRWPRHAPANRASHNPALKVMIVTMWKASKAYSNIKRSIDDDNDNHLFWDPDNR